VIAASQPGADGEFVLCWNSQTDGSLVGTAARRLDASGNPTGSEFVLNTYTLGFQETCDVAAEANGNFVAVWTDSNTLPPRDGWGFGIFGQRYDASNNRLGSE
jgi:large repetitive protein